MLVCGLENIEVSDIELNKNKKMYATDVFKLIERKYKNEEIYFIMGADNFINITKWKNAESIIKKYKYIVLSRDNIDLSKYIEDNKLIHKYKNNIQIIDDNKYIKYNSTEFREKIKEEKQYNQEIVPDQVIDYIIKNDLYK